MSDSLQPMDCSPPGSPVPAILQARALESVAISFSRDLPNPGIEPASLSYPLLAGGFSNTSIKIGSPRILGGFFNGRGIKVIRGRSGSVF